MTESQIFDVVVVGAGPGGATAAANLAAEGLDVLLLERNRLPRDKPCGGGLSPKTYRLLDLDFDDLVLARPKRVTLQAPRYGPVTVESRTDSIWMIQRSAFDQRLVDHAIDKGAQLRTNIIVREVRAGDAAKLAEVETDGGYLRARAVIGADGSDSVVARSVGLRSHRDRHYILALEAETTRPANTPEEAAIIDFSLARGYSWFFPKGELCNVGVGTDDRRQFRQLRQHLARFVERHHLAFSQPLRVVGHKIPAWSRAEPLHRGNVVLVGDAAGVADPFFGEGIAYAVQTGRFAAAAVSQFCQGHWPDLTAYTISVQSVLARDLRFWSILSQVIYRAPSLSLRLLASNRLFQRLADQAISGDKSFSKTWKKR